MLKYHIDGCDEHSSLKDDPRFSEIERHVYAVLRVKRDVPRISAVYLNSRAIGRRSYRGLPMSPLGLTMILRRSRLSLEDRGNCQLD